jgi:hypothetical protein
MSRFKNLSSVDLRVALSQGLMRTCLLLRIASG